MDGPLEFCRHCRDEFWDPDSPGYRATEILPAEFILWGKLFPAEALGPACYGHAAEHLPSGALSPMQIGQYAVFDLRGLRRVQERPT